MHFLTCLIISYLRYMCLFLYSGVQHILCFVFGFACLRLVSCVPNVANLSGLFILEYTSAFLLQLITTQIEVTASQVSTWVRF
jgi:hypothetical protein